MKNKPLLIGIAKYYRLGSRGNRHKLVIDNSELSPIIKKEIEKSLHDDTQKTKTVENIIRNKKIEIFIKDDFNIINRATKRG